MMTYVTAFIFYTLAMIGILLIGFVVYKKTFLINKGENNGTIKIVDSLPIGNKKMLLVVKIKNEKFLIASGVEHTTFLSKLESSSENTSTSENITPKKEEVLSFKDEIKPQAQMRFDDVQKIRAQAIQKQFQELYEQEDDEIKQNNTLNRKEVLKQLLKELNAKSGSKF